MARKAYGNHATQVNLSTHPDDGTSPVGSAEWNAALDKQGMLGFEQQTISSATLRTIASGVATVYDTVTIVTSESSTTDTLDKLTIANTSEFDLIYLFANTGHTITVTHTASPSADGHIFTVGQADEVLSATKPTILIRRGNYWYGYGGGTVSDGSITTAKLAANAVDGTKIALTSDAIGDIMYYDGTNYVRLAKGSANEVLQMGGSNIPEWGTVQATEIAAGAVGTSELAADAVTAAEIGDDVINSEHYAAGSIDLEHMSSQSVDEDNLHVSNAPTNGYMLTAQSGNAGGLTWAASGGGNHTEQGWDVYTTHTGSTTASDGIAYMFARKIDSNNDGLYIMLWKNGASTEVQIA